MQPLPNRVGALEADYADSKPFLAILSFLILQTSVEAQSGGPPLPQFEDAPTTFMTQPPAGRLVLRQPAQYGKPQHILLHRGCKLEVRGNLDNTQTRVGMQVGANEPVTDLFTKEWVFTWDLTREFHDSARLQVYRLDGSTRVPIWRVLVDLIGEELAELSSDSNPESPGDEISLIVSSKQPAAILGYDMEMDEAPAIIVMSDKGRGVIRTNQVPTGDHTLRAKVRTNDGAVWTTNSISFHIHSRVRVLPLRGDTVDLTRDTQPVPLHLQVDCDNTQSRFLSS